MRYVGNVIRPPSEARSLILQVTTGCSHNKCRFCGAYPQAFTIKPLPRVAEDLDWFQRHEDPGLRRMFLADGNALIRKTQDLLDIIAMARERFPSLGRVGVYANADDVLRKTDEELKALADAGLAIAYVGLESGDDEVLQAMNKGVTASEIVDAVVRLQSAGIKASVMALLGLAGATVEVSHRHARLTAKAVNDMKPRYLSFLTVMVIPGTPLHADVEAGRFELPDSRGMLEELQVALADLDLEGTIFRANHASNYLPLAGTLPRDKTRLLEVIDGALAGTVPLVPEFFRAL